MGPEARVPEFANFWGYGGSFDLSSSSFLRTGGEVSGVASHGWSRAARARGDPARRARRVRREEAAQRRLRSRRRRARIQKGHERGRGGAERSAEADPRRGHGRRGVPGRRREEERPEDRAE